MARTKRRSFGKFLRGTVKDVVMPTSVGLGLALAGCGSSGDKADGPMAVMPPRMDGSSQADRLNLDGVMASDAPQLRLDAPIAIMPPAKDASTVDRRPDSRIYAIMPPRDAGADTGETRRDAPIYAIMPIRRDAGDDATAPDAGLVKPDAKLDTKPLLKDGGPIYAIMPLAVLPPRS